MAIAYYDSRHTTKLVQLLKDEGFPRIISDPAFRTLAAFFCSSLPFPVLLRQDTLPVIKEYVCAYLVHVLTRVLILKQTSTTKLTYLSYDQIRYALTSPSFFVNLNNERQTRIIQRFHPTSDTRFYYYDDPTPQYMYGFENIDASFVSSFADLSLSSHNRNNTNRNNTNRNNTNEAGPSYSPSTECTLYEPNDDEDNDNEEEDDISMDEDDDLTLTENDRDTNDEQKSELSDAPEEDAEVQEAELKALRERYRLDDVLISGHKIKSLMIWVFEKHLNLWHVLHDPIVIQKNAIEAIRICLEHDMKRILEIAAQNASNDQNNSGDNENEVTLEHILDATYLLHIGFMDQ